MYQTKFSGTNQNELSNRNYYAIIGLVLLYGLLLTVLLCMFCTSIFLKWNPILILIGYFLSCILGCIICKTTDNLVTAFIGYHLVIFPVSVVLSFSLANYSQFPFSVFIWVAFSILVILIVDKIFSINTVKRSVLPDLILIILIELLMALFGSMNSNLWNAVIIGIFSSYIVSYRFQKIRQESHSIYHVIDTAIDLYLIIMILFKVFTRIIIK